MNFIQKNRVLLSHIGFWLGYYMLMTMALLNFNPTVYHPIRVLLLVITHASLAYVNMWLLVPWLFLRKRYLIFIFITIGLIQGAFEVFFWVNQFIPPYDPFRTLSKEARAGRIALLTYMFVIAAMSTGHKVLQISEAKEKELGDLRRQKLEKEQETNQLKNENLETELKFLKSQINPHFLFNALNNIYTLAYIQDQKAPEMILKLSDMLRYILYDCTSQEVPIDKEISYINNYVELQRLKNDELDVKVAIDQGIGGHTKIAPMLFIPFIENSFKHSKIEDTENGWIALSLSQQEGQLCFKISNSKPNTEFTKDKVGGIGLQNVRRRLELLYPQQHQLTINDNEDSFEVELLLL